MIHDVESVKPFAEAVAALDASVRRHGFGVLHVHDLGATLRGKGVPFAEECKIFEICQPQQAAQVLAIDLRLNMALPCRISVYTEQGRTRLGMIRPQAMLAMHSDEPALGVIARQVEEATRQMIEEAK